MESLEYQRAMRERLERLERMDPTLAERVLASEVRWAVVIPTLATRESVEQLRGEMKEGLGALRAEVGVLRAEMHQSLGHAMKWFVGISVSAVVAVATLMTALMPLMISQARGHEPVALAVPLHGEDDGS